MASDFKGIIKRKLRLWDVPVPVIVTITEEGVAFSVPKSRTKVTSSWESIARHAETPVNVPSALFREPIKLLQHQAKRLQERG